MSDDPTPSEPAVDIAVAALESARAIAGGRALDGHPGSGSPTAARTSRKRRRYTDGPTYSGARPDDRDPVRVGDIVRRSAPELGWSAPLAEARLFGQWASVVGADIAARCQPVSLNDGDLKVSAESTAWATQLRLMAPQILARVAAGLPSGMVKRILFAGPTAPSWRHGPWSSRGRGVRDTYG